MLASVKEGPNETKNGPDSVCVRVVLCMCKVWSRETCRDQSDGYWQNSLYRNATLN